MSETPKISVIIPVYNTGKYLRGCLDSIINQTFRGIEIICIDDGSSDDSPDILKEYAAKDTRIQVITQGNKRQASARNAGIDNAKGEYIYFMDSDDLLKPEALEILFNTAQQENTDILYFDGEILYEDKELTDVPGGMKGDYYTRKNKYPGILPGPEFFAAINKNNEYRCSPCLQLIRAEHIKSNNIRFFEGIYYEDELFSFLCLMQAERVAHINKAFFIRRQYPDSTTNSKKGEHRFFGFITVYRETELFLSGKCYPEDIRQQTNRHLEYLLGGIKRAYDNSGDSWMWIERLNKEERKLAKQLLEISLTEETIRQLSSGNERHGNLKNPGMPFIHDVNKTLEQYGAKRILKYIIKTRLFAGSPLWMKKIYKKIPGK